MTGKAVVERDVRGDVIVLRMNYGKVSALDTEFCNAMVDELDSIERDGPRALVLTGTGTTFSAGVNLFRPLDGGAEYVHRFLPFSGRCFCSASRWSSRSTATRSRVAAFSFQLRITG
jgi:enoyl-CoA hydratase